MGETRAARPKGLLPITAGGGLCLAAFAAYELARSGGEGETLQGAEPPWVETAPENSDAGALSAAASTVAAAEQGLRRDTIEPARLAAPGFPPSHDPLAQAADDLDAFATMSLNGVVHVNDTLERMLAFASLPVSAHPDLDYEDDDAIAYRLLGTPEDTEARVLVGLQPYEIGETTFRYLQLEIDVAVGTHDLVDGAMRYPPNVGLSVSYDAHDPEEPARAALLVQRDVALGESRRSGIDAYQGRYTTGSYYCVDLLEDPPQVVCGTVGMVDGQRLPSIQSFEGVSPLAGDTQLDVELLGEILGRLREHLATIKGEN